MEIKKFKEQIIEVVTGYKCDICGEKCANDEYLEMDASWGYFSPWDMEQWSAQICIECIKKHFINLVKFTKNKSDLW